MKGPGEGEGEGGEGRALGVWERAPMTGLPGGLTIANENRRVRGWGRRPPPRRDGMGWEAEGRVGGTTAPPTDVEGGGVMGGVALLGLIAPYLTLSVIPGISRPKGPRVWANSPVQRADLPPPLHPGVTTRGHGGRDRQGGPGRGGGGGAGSEDGDGVEGAAGVAVERGGRGVREEGAHGAISCCAGIRRERVCPPPLRGAT